jgi:polar amino acid transport system substrate-binding protein
MFPVRLSPAVLVPAALSVALLLSGCGSSNGSGASPTATPMQKSGTVHGTRNDLGLVNADVLTVCSDTSYPPMESANPNNPGQYVGADVDLANALAKQIHVMSAKIVNTSFDSIIPALDAKRCDVIMSSMSDTPARAKVVNFIDYLVGEEAILVNKSGPIHANDYSGLCGKTVAVERGTTELDGLNKANTTCSAKIHILPFTEDTAAYEAFAVGHADAYTGDVPVVGAYAKKNPTKYRLAGTPINLHEPYGIAIRKSNTALKTALQGALSKIMANGEYMRILSKWGIAAAAMKK